jgi:teichuronic acid biosynthesis glycosyltransferase TuaG
VNHELVCIVMPAYNAQGFVGDAIASICAQTHTRWELFVVDDCSTDGTRDVARAWASRDPRITLLTTQQNSGSSVARNFALSRRAGRYVAFLDADDLWVADKLEKQLRFMRDRGAAFSFTAYRKFSAAGPGGVVGARHMVTWGDMLKGNRIGCSTVMLDAQALPPLAFPTSLGRQEDYALWLALLRGGECAFGLDEPLVQYRVHQSSKSASKLPSVTAQWHVYRDLEKLPRLRAAWYLGHYAVRGIMKALR